MRSLVAIALLAAVAAGADEKQRIHALVERLGAPTYEERRAAYVQLAALGEKAVPHLAKVNSNDPDVLRFLRELTRSTRTLKLKLQAPGEPQPLGSPLVLRLELTNRTGATHQLALVRGSKRGTGTLSTFSLRLGDGRRFLLRPDQVEVLTKFDRLPVLRPGAVLRFELRLEGPDSPLRRPGRIEITVAYEGLVQRWPGLAAGPQASADTGNLTLAAPSVAVTAYGRKPKEIEAALRSKDQKRRASAIGELGVREDAELVPVLRRHADVRDLRLIAVRRLGALALEEDFQLLYDAARHGSLEVRKAAVGALGKYQRRKARTRLVYLTTDRELRQDAIRALREHKHYVTIDCFVRLLRLGQEHPVVMNEMLNAIHKWTKMPLTNRRSEIAAFEAWWQKNRYDWAKRNGLIGR